MNHLRDVLILGGGPAGCSAALYCARAGLDTLLIEQFAPGGQMMLTGQVENYPGIPDGISGPQLSESMRRSAEEAGAELMLSQALAVRLNGAVKTIQTPNGTLSGRSVILATGASPRRLQLSGEKKLTGRGVHYCAECDGMFYRGRPVAVLGGGSSAAGDALSLSRICSDVYLIFRQKKLRAEQPVLQALSLAPNLRLYPNCTLEALLGETYLTGLSVQNHESRTSSVLSCDALFVCIGRIPETSLFQTELALDSAGYIPVDESTRTRLPGVFAAGDIRAKPFRQIVTAAADGAAAAHAAAEYLSALS